jgi:hypothetical protein
MGPRIHFYSISFIIIWKTILVFVLIFLLIKKLKLINNYIKLGYLFALKIWLSYGSFMYISDTLTLFSKFILIPLVAHFTLNYLTNNNFVKFLNFIKTISIYTIISTIPFLLNLLEPNSEGYDLSAYGIADSFGFAGLYQNEHSASVNMALSIIILTYFFLKNNNNFYRFFYFILILLGLYVEYITYVRTGYLGLLAASYFLLYKGQKLKIKLIIIFFAGIISISLFSLYQNDKVLQMRLQDKTIYRENTSEDNLGSGRLLFAKTNIENLFESNIPVIFFGLGQEYSKDLMETKIDNHLVSHNGYVDALVHYGILGLIIFLSMLYQAYIIIRKNKKNILYNLTIAIFIIFLFVTLTQAFYFFFLNGFLSMLLIMLNHKEQIKII